jgi:predicted transcriptional regulator of viral defense system
MTSHEKAVNIIREHGGIIRTSQAIESGVHPRTLYALHDIGTIEKISRGVYRLVELPEISNPDLVIVSSRIPQGVICLVSALSFHEITTQIPHEVNVALKYGAKTPLVDYPPISLHRFSGEAFLSGVEEHEIDGVTVRIYSPEKTIADCFKFRNKIGVDVVLESLKLYKSRKQFNVNKLMKYAKIDRMEKVMIPYIEAVL